MMSHHGLYIEHGGVIYTKKISKYNVWELPPLPTSYTYQKKKKKKKVVKRLLTHSCSWDFFFMVAKYLLQL